MKLVQFEDLILCFFFTDARLFTASRVVCVNGFLRCVCLRISLDANVTFAYFKVAVINIFKNTRRTSRPSLVTIKLDSFVKRVIY